MTDYNLNRRLPPIRACLFDMDGLLIDSEDIYTFVINQILHEYGKPNLPWSIKAQLQGRPQPQVRVLFLHNSGEHSLVIWHKHYRKRLYSNLLFFPTVYSLVKCFKNGPSYPSRRKSYRRKSLHFNDPSSQRHNRCLVLCS